MPENTRLLNCPACGAALEPPAGQSVMQCPYCHNSVEIPGTIPTGNGWDQAKLLALIQAGDKNGAKKLVRKWTGASRAEAKNVVEALERGEQVDLAHLPPARRALPGTAGRAPKTISPSGVQPAQRKGRGSRPAIAAFMVLVVWVVIVFFFARSSLGLLFLGPASAPTTTATPPATSTPAPTPTPSFSTQLLAFGSGGNGVGELNLPAPIGVDRDGKIYVGNTENGRITVFDQTGAFMRLINLGDKIYIDDMGVAPDGSAYACHNGQIFKLDARGKGTPLVYNNLEPNEIVTFQHLAIGADGSVVASVEQDQIIRFNPDGKVDLVILKAFSSVIGTNDGTGTYLAVDKQGNIYALGYGTGIVLKYSPEGKFIHQFGGKALDKAKDITPGSFSVPSAIAVDGYGRIFVSDRWGVQVFSPNYKYLNSFKTSGSVFGMTFDANNTLYIVTNEPQVIILAVQKPQ